MLIGKITEPNDWHALLRSILDAPAVEISVLNIISDKVSGSIGVRNGRYFVGAHTSGGAVGVAALRELCSLEHGAYSYIDANASTHGQIDQGLKVDINVLLGAQEPAPAPQAAPAAAPPMTPADEATEELRRTFQALRPVSSPQGRFSASVPPAPGAHPLQSNPGASPPHAAPAPGSYGYASAATAEQPKGGSAVDKLIYGAANTFMKLTALSARGTANSLPNSVQPPTPMAGGAQMQQTGSKPNPWAQKAAAQSNAAPPHQSAADAEMPSSTWENPDDLPQPVGMVDTVRATAWRIASRVAMAAKARIDADERLTENRRLRSIEGETAEETDKARRQMWPPDAATIALFVVVLLGVGVLAGGIWIGMNFFGTKPYIAVGKKYLQDGRNDLAIVQFTAAIQKNAEDADALQLRAETYEKEKDYEHAAADFARLAELRPKMHAAARKAAFYQFKLKKYDDALKNCQRILATQPDDESIKAQLVMNLARSGKYEEAIAAGKKIDGELVPSYLVPDFLGSLAFAYTNAGDAQKAAGLYSKALKADPTNETNLAERAEAFMKAKDYKHAAADYIALTKLAPARAGGYADAAKAAFLGGDYETAAQQYEKANKFDPAAEYYLRLADSHMALGKFGHAVSDCDSALTLQPSSAEAKKLRAVALKKAQETKAIVTARITPEYADAKGTQMMPRDPKGATDPLTEMGYNALIQGDANRAIQFLSIAVKRTPNDNMAHRFLGNSLMQKERFREAFDQYSALSANNALLPSDELSYAKAADQSGRTDRAIEIYLRSLQRDPTYVQARIDLIKLCVAKGYKDKAQQVATEGMAMSPAAKDEFNNALQGR